MDFNKLTSTFLWVGLLFFLFIGPQTVSGQSTSKDITPKTMEVNGVNLHYVEKGEGVPVVFVHGAVGDYRTWHYQMEDFSKRYRAISYSRRYYHPNEVPIDSRAC